MDPPSGETRERRHQRRPRWAVIAFYVGLILIVAVLERYLSGDDEAATVRPALRTSSTGSALPPTRTERQSKRDDRGASNGDRPDVAARNERTDPSGHGRAAGTDDDQLATKPTKVDTADAAPSIGTPTARGKPPIERSAGTLAEPPTDIARPASDKLIVRNQTIYDENRRVVYRGDVDLRPTLERIELGRRLRFPNDGSVFQNRERRLPRQPAGYYREYVHPTPNDDGPGAQRLVVGREGEVYYTPDHYRTFRRIR